MDIYRSFELAEATSDIKIGFYLLAQHKEQVLI